ncbi:hypothetical protein COW36_16115 [bacterium (Candidatus Blackallbacteria) CG17_big_fil_post_rev_8_21_14_2_50_48_46]|uniref:Methyltransferase n=1 Tax=bacterium (Candidatus Blackallbacteria) CG17_big_fil_post_rev_8_21_14_2_50_48_46 TaxID=2014261 RepID=A0A2M7G1V8_9BACT|nr:MAG: hypothetical protein COW64_08550 [bacterium (Candidatus Blackallbacteria) CG18_big_fil_WC_8_21_14_2_50_49_26]PIW15728.1 MAG: hypothetical protein COW36_16115 [bacterium (Candidatus Blackallbacteria) CG17_big_fil_post_rev_8_21_14_2_50_48_46]PIW49230.1 MAG: hypothetical protein COW20_06625 [bacterium (Candidatus Blackallbacteria) CG13_big_fil_rev_8_21_14_2_50_49_14]
MRLLVLGVYAPPDDEELKPSDLRSYPGLLLENPTTTRQRPVRNLASALQECESFQPDLLVFQGETGVALHWQSLFEKCYPQLFSFVSNQHDLFKILAELNPRLWELRRRRLKDKSAPYPAPGPVEKEQLFAQLETEARSLAQARLEPWLEAHPRLKTFLPLVSSEDFERQLYCYALLETALEDWKSPTSVRVLDVGTHAWSYAPALSAFFREKASLVELTGLELDPWYLIEGVTRGDLARYYAKTSQARFLEADFLNFHEKQEIICHFLPLILPQNALLWRIPLEMHHPVRLLKHSWDRLRPGGRCLLYNGKEIEYQELLKNIKHAGLTPLRTGPWVCPWRQKQQGYLTLLERPAK